MKKWHKRNIFNNVWPALLIGITLIASMVYAKDRNEKKENTDWYQWRGPNRDNISYEKGLLKQWPEKGPEVLWRISIGDGYSGISVSNDKIFSMWDSGDSQFLFCLNSLNGEIIWKLKVDDKYPEHFGNGPRSTPIIDKNNVYTVSAGGKLFATNIDNGQAFWSHDLVSEFGCQMPAHGYSSSPLINEEKLIVEVGGKDDFAFVAFNKITGDVVWHSQTDEPAYSSPILVTIDGAPQILFLSAKSLLALSPNNGDLIWQHDWESRCPSSHIPVNSSTPIFIAPNKIFLSSGYGTITGASLIQINKKNENYSVENIWFNDKMKNLINSSVITKDYIYGFDTAIFKCMNALTGKVKWKTLKIKRGSLIALEDHLLVLGEDGKLALVKKTSEKYIEVASLQILKGKCWTSPSLSGGKLYLRNHQEMVCLDISEK